MSLARCDNCDRLIDTDDDPDSCEKVGEILCEWCRLVNHNED